MAPSLRLISLEAEDRFRAEALRTRDCEEAWHDCDETWPQLIHSVWFTVVEHLQ